MLFIPTSMADIGSYVSSTLSMLTATSSALFTLILIFGAFRYMTSCGDPEKIVSAKKVIKNAILGLLIILSANLFSTFLIHSVGHGQTNNINSSTLKISAIPPVQTKNGLLEIILKTITGVFGNIIQTIASPFLKALTYFTSSTPLITENTSVYNLWLVMVGISDSLIVLVLALLGLHVMSFSSLGLSEINVKQLLPRVGYIFVLINISVYLIDEVIKLCNQIIFAISNGGASLQIWNTLMSIFNKADLYSLAASLIMLVFLAMSVVLIIYYLSRIVTIYLGAVLSPLVLLCLLIPSLKDFATSAIRKYLVSIFVLLVHVVILELASSILSEIIAGNNNSPDPLLSLIFGLATLVCLIKSQSVLSELAVISLAPRIAKKIGEKFVIGASLIGSSAAQSAASMLPAVGINDRPRPYSSMAGGSSTYHGTGNKNGDSK